MFLSTVWVACLAGSGLAAVIDTDSTARRDLGPVGAGSCTGCQGICVEGICSPVVIARRGFGAIDDGSCTDCQGFCVDGICSPVVIARRDPTELEGPVTPRGLGTFDDGCDEDCDGICVAGVCTDIDDLPVSIARRGKPPVGHCPGCRGICIEGICSPVIIARRDATVLGAPVAPRGLADPCADCDGDCVAGICTPVEIGDECEGDFVNEGGVCVGAIA